MTGGINENQGRELLELHTVGVDAGYTQADVVRGLALPHRPRHRQPRRPRATYVFRAANHDNEAKQVFGLSVPAGGGEGDVQRLFDHLASHPATARYIAKRLCQRFVADDPPPASSSGWPTSSSARTATSARSRRRSSAARSSGPRPSARGKPRTPLEFVVGTLRAAGAEVQNPRAVRTALGDMGMPLYACNPPTGYSNRGADWLNPSSQLYRMNFALDLAAGAVSGVTADVRAPHPRAAAAIPTTRARPPRRSTARSSAAPSRAPPLAAASSVDTSGPVAVPVRVAGLLFAEPRDAGEVRP